MSWMAKLYETYEKGMALDLPLEALPLPTSHTLQNAHVNIVIDDKGNFKRALVLEKTQIILPATEESAGRTSGEAPHPLADKIQYVAKDYAEHGGTKKSYFASYERLLAKWCSSPFSHPKACAVHAYVSKGCVVADLVANGILHVDEQGKLLQKWSCEAAENMPEPAVFKTLPKKEGKIEQGDAMVCWTVETLGDPCRNTWTDLNLFKSWAEFDAMSEGSKGLCFVSGQELKLAENHPAKLRHTGDKAKLVSSNDKDGFTFRGRFVSSEQAAGISFDVTQKAHNALRWLLSRQGFKNGDQAYVAWAVSGKSIPDPLQDSYAMLSTDPSFQEDEDQEQLDVEHQVDQSADIGQSFALKFRKYLAGYRTTLEPSEQIMVMGLDSATPGRMAVVYCRELFASDFLDRIELWHKQFSWPQRHVKEFSDPKGKKVSKVIWPVSCPVPKAIAEAAYGDVLKSNESLKKNLLERLLPCIVDGNPFPQDIMLSVVRRASNRNNCEPWEWERTLGIACALFRGFQARQPNINNRRTYAMGLEKDRSDRNYLYGRLLAVAERIEEIALNVGEENRPTNAARLMQRFADRPCSTWRTLELNLQPYMQRLQTSRGPFLTNCKKELDAIHAAFSADDFSSDQPLNGEFLLGYHCQRMELRKKKLDDKAAENNNEE